MKNYLEELYDDCIVSAKGDYPKDPKYTNALIEMERLDIELTKRLDANGRELFQGFQNAHTTVSSIDERGVFVNSFKMGARMMLEVLTGG